MEMPRRQALTLILGLVLLAAALLVFHQTISGWFFTPESSDFSKRPVLAELNHRQGYVEIRHYGHKLFKAVEQSQVLIYEGDSIRTGSLSQATLDFTSHYSIQLSQNGQFYLEHQGASDVVILSLLRGKISVLQAGENGKLQILENGFLHDPISRFPEKPLVVRENEVSPPPKADSAENDESTEASDTLSTEYIVSVIQGQKAFLDRCYAEHLQTNTASRGKMNFTFKIDPSGTVSNVHLVNSTLQDPQLQKCVSSVIERCRFHAFNADPIVANYPIIFE